MYQEGPLKRTPAIQGSENNSGASKGDRIEFNPDRTWANRFDAGNEFGTGTEVRGAQSLFPRTAATASLEVEFCIVLPTHSKHIRVRADTYVFLHICIKAAHFPPVPILRTRAR